MEAAFRFWSTWPPPPWPQLHQVGLTTERTVVRGPRTGGNGRAAHLVKFPQVILLEDLDHVCAICPPKRIHMERIQHSRFVQPSWKDRQRTLRLGGMVARPDGHPDR